MDYETFCESVERYNDAWHAITEGLTDKKLDRYLAAAAPFEASESKDMRLFGLRLRQNYMAMKSGMTRPTRRLVERNLGVMQKALERQLARYGDGS